MDETKATYTGIIIGGVAGFGIAVLGVLAAPLLAPAVGAFTIGVAMVICGIAGGAAGLKTAEKINKRKD